MNYFLHMLRKCFENVNAKHKPQTALFVTYTMLKNFILCETLIDFSNFFPSPQNEVYLPLAPSCGVEE